ncbi:MAG: basic amino acid ABC transporter substrate-binding protein [Spirochaetales bacterium]|nr:basic amino acid ABC transporter substrate-binding protein [Exilispira sp.]NMC66975.1 basic amino acid ABC transporter substrate-binding protein [Spirochaetales bacterium]
MKSKLLVVFFVMLFVLVAFFGCKKEASVLKVGTNAEYPPFEYKDGDQFLGIDMDIARYVATKLGKQIEINDIDFDSLIPSLQNNKFDMVIAAMTITDERKEIVDFSIPYYTANQSIIVKQDSSLTITSEEDLAKLKIGVQRGTTGEAYIDENFIQTKKMKDTMLIRFDNNINAVQELLNGNVDCVIIDDSAAKGYEKLKPVKVIYTIESNESYGIAFPKGSKLVEKVNKIIDELLKSNEWLELIKKYF